MYLLVMNSVGYKNVERCHHIETDSIGRTMGRVKADLMMDFGAAWPWDSSYQQAMAHKEIGLGESIK